MRRAPVLPFVLSKVLSKDEVLQIIVRNIVENYSSNEISVGKHEKKESFFWFIKEVGYISDAFLIPILEES